VEGIRTAGSPRKEESLTSSVGLSGSLAVSYGWGVLLPQASIEWVHEYRKDQQYIKAHFAEDMNPLPASVVYSTEAPDRDYFHLDIGVSAVFPHGIQPFFNARAMFGHAYYDNYTITLGVRAEL